MENYAVVKNIAKSLTERQSLCATKPCVSLMFGNSRRKSRDKNVLTILKRKAYLMDKYDF